MLEDRGGTALQQYGLRRQAVLVMLDAFQEFDPYRQGQSVPQV
jgi:hypothetical protein